MREADRGVEAQDERRAERRIVQQPSTRTSFSGIRIAQAGERLHLERPNLSKLIRKLEHALDTDLLERGAGGSQLTRHGKAAFDPARDLLSALEALRAAVNDRA